MSKCPCCGGQVADEDRLLVDLSSNTLQYRGRSIRVMSREAEMAAVLLRRAPQAVAPESMIHQVFGAFEPKDPRKLLSVYASFLRRNLWKLGWDVECIRGRGYRLVPHVERKELCRSQ